MAGITQSGEKVIGKSASPSASTTGSRRSWPRKTRRFSTGGEGSAGSGLQEPWH